MHLRRLHRTYATTLKPSYEELARGLVENHLIPHFRGADMRTIREADLLQFVKVKLDAGLGLKTIHNALSVLRRAFNLLHREEHVDRNPAAHIGELLDCVERRTATETRVIDARTNDEIATLLRLAQEHAPGFYPALATLVYTGMRRGEVLGLQWCDVDFTSRQIHVRRAIVKSQLTTPKSGRDRKVVMAPALALLLLDLLAPRSDGAGSS